MMKWIACQIICLNLAYVLIIQHVFLKVWSKSWLSVALFRFWANTFTLFETQIPSAEKKCYKSYFTSWLDLISICDFEYYLCQLVFQGFTFEWLFLLIVSIFFDCQHNNWQITLQSIDAWMFKTWLLSKSWTCSQCFQVFKSAVCLVLYV